MKFKKYKTTTTEIKKLMKDQSNDSLEKEIYMNIYQLKRVFEHTFGNDNIVFEEDFLNDTLDLINEQINYIKLKNDEFHKRYKSGDIK